MVCTGNICRSPLAEAVLRSRLRGLNVAVRSAGTRARDGMAMTHQAAALAEIRGADPAEVATHRSQLLRAAHISAAHLTVCMGRDHRREVVEIYPGSVRSAFTARELARLVEDVSDDDLRAAGASVERAATESPQHRMGAALSFLAQRRGVSQPPSNVGEEDIVDPYHRSLATYERSAAQLDPSLRAIERVVRAALLV